MLLQSQHVNLDQSAAEFGWWRDLLEHLIDVEVGAKNEDHSIYNNKRQYDHFFHIVDTINQSYKAKSYLDHYHEMCH